MFTAFDMRRPWLCHAVFRFQHRNLLAVAIVQFTVAEVVPFTQRRQILITQHPLGTGRKDRLLVGVTGSEMVEGQVQHDGHDRRRADARMENGREPAWEVIVEVRRGDRDHAEADGGGDNDQIDVVAVVDLCLLYTSDAADE